VYIDRAAGVLHLFDEGDVHAFVHRLRSRSVPVNLLASGAYADDACRCKGWGCKGGPGWRGPDGTCASKSALATTCGSPAGAPCKQESATRVCFGRQSALAAPKPAQTQLASTSSGLLAGGAVA